MHQQKQISPDVLLVNVDTDEYVFPVQLLSMEPSLYI
jgi:hypothetical protein